MPSLTSILLNTNNLITQSTLAVTLSLFLSFLKIPSLFLYGLHTYIHPDDVTPQNNTNGTRAAIRRPGALDSEQIKPRKKSKERFEFDENKAQIFRLKLNEDHLASRIYFKEYFGAFNSSFIALSSILVHGFLLNVDGDLGVVKSGSVIPVLLGVLAFVRLIYLVGRASFERSASKRLERQLSGLVGVIGFVFGLCVAFGVVPRRVLDFGFGERLDGLGKFVVAVLMGCIAGFLYIPALRSVRAFWLGTDQVRASLSIISCGWFERALLYSNYVLLVFTSLLWVNPFSVLFVNENVEGKPGLGGVFGKRTRGMELAGGIGMSRTSFDQFRFWCLLATGILQVSTLRSNVQLFLNEAVLCWYQRLHASKVPDLDYSRAKVFLHNHYVCLVVLQLFAPAAMVLLLLGISRFDDNFFTGLTNYSSLVKEVVLFMAWWIVFVFAVFSTAILALYRRGILYVS